METERLLKFITGNTEENEANEVISWINSSPENKKEFFRLKNLMALSSSNKKVLNIDNEFSAINSKLNSRNSFKYKILNKYSKYAAVLLIAILLGFSISEIRYRLASSDSNIKYHEFYSPKGQISEFLLTDGTRIWLNSDTRVKIPSDFSPKNRKLQLIGEAFFEVKKDKAHPFLVKTNDIFVKVYGTSFNISSYVSDNFIEATLTEGKIGIKSISGKKIAVLAPGQQLIYEKSTGESITLNVDTSPYENWRDGKMIFKDRSLEYIAGKLSRWYSVDIEFKDTDIKNIRFTGTILKNKPLSQVLDVITLSAPVGFSIKINHDKNNQVQLYSLKNNINMN